MSLQHGGSCGSFLQVIVLLSSSELCAKWQEPFVVTQRVGDVDYEDVHPGRCSASQIYHLNLLKAQKEAPPVPLGSLVTDRDELGPVVPPKTRNSVLLKQ